jgi:cbb3-type cytochrome oxidase subunit 3
MRSIRGRVILLVVAVQLLASAAAVGFALLYVHRALWSSLDSELQARMVALLALVGEAEENPNGLEFDRDQANIPAEDLFYIQDSHGARIAGSSLWLGGRPKDPKALEWGWAFQNGTTPYRAKALIRAPILDQENRKVPQLKVSLFYAMPSRQTEVQFLNAARVSVAVGILILLFSCALTWWAVGRGMRPLTDFASQADLIEPDGPQFSESKGMHTI